MIKNNILENNSSMWLKHIRFIIMSLAHFQICMLLHLVWTKQYVFVKEPPD